MSKRVFIHLKAAQDVLREMCKKLSKVKSPVIPDSEGLPCPIRGLKKSPLIYGYRNSDDLSIWPGVDGRITVGLLVGKASNPETFSQSIEENINIKASHKLLAHKFTNYLRSKSKYTYCKSFNDGGHWRRFVVRSNDIGHHLCTAIMHPQKLSPGELNDEKQNIYKYFQPLAEELSLKSFYFQACPKARCTNEEAKFELILGDTCLEETLNGIKVRILPDSYLENNKGAAEVLNDTIVEEIEPEADMIVIDLHPNLGVFSCFIAPTVKKVIGVYESPEIHKQAKFTLQENRVANCSFVVDAIENFLPQINIDYHTEDLVLVVRPPPSGLSSGTINLIRSVSCVKKLVYVANEPMRGALKNFVHLCLPFRPNDGIEGDGFVPLRATPIDLFPNTNRLNLITTFIRYH